MEQHHLISTALTLSCLLNLWLAISYHQLRRKKPRKLDITATDLLHDFTHRGEAILRVSVLDAQNLLLRSPRG